MSHLLFYDVMQRMVVVVLLMLWTACWFHLQWSRLLDPWRWSR